MRIFHVISSGGMYGAEHVLLNLCRSLRKLDCDVTVGVFRNATNPHTEIGDRLTAENIEVVEIPCAGRVDWAAIKKTRHLMRQVQTDVVHSHGYKGDIYSYLATRFASIPLVATAHNWTGESELPPIYNKLDRVVLRRFSAVAAVSDGVAQVLDGSGVAAKKIIRIANGIDLTPYEEAIPAARRELHDSNAPIVGLVGRLVQEKGCFEFVRAAAQVLPTFPEARFLLVGEGPERDSLEQLARDLQIDKSVVFAGHRNDMPSVYASLAICVLPSFEEGMPMTLMEAMAAGRSVIATPVGQIPAMVDQETNGLLVNPGNVGELSSAMMRLLGDVVLRQRMGENGREKAQRLFSADSMARAYLNLYRHVLRGQTGEAVRSLGGA
jgi:glycosyltransferase involved in cell wall biosynthesis